MTAAHDLYLELRIRLAFVRWVSRGRPAPPAALVKQGVVREFGRRFGLGTFVETGTFRGDMVYAMRYTFRRIVSVELADARVVRIGRTMSFGRVTLSSATDNKPVAMVSSAFAMLS